MGSYSSKLNGLAMTPNWINDPSPVWDEIKTYLADDTGEIEDSGEFLGIFDKKEMAGAFLIKPMNAYCYEVHGGVKRKYWGKGIEICELLKLTIFYSTPCLKVVAIIPEFNRLMRRCVEKNGMKKEGILTKSYLKWSRLHDQIIYGITKGEMRCLPTNMSKKC